MIRKIIHENRLIIYIYSVSALYQTTHIYKVQESRTDKEQYYSRQTIGQEKQGQVDEEEGTYGRNFKGELERIITTTTTTTTTATTTTTTTAILIHVINTMLMLSDKLMILDVRSVNFSF